MPRSNPTQTLHPQTSHSPRPLPSFVSATPLLSVSVTFHAFSSAVHLPFGPSVVSDVLTMREFKQIAAAKLQGASHEQIAKSNEEARAIFAGLDANGDARIDAKEHFAYASGTFAGLAAMQALFGLADTNGDRHLSSEELVECRSNPKFGGSAAFHHAQDWIHNIEAEVESGLELRQVGAKFEL